MSKEEYWGDAKKKQMPQKDGMLQSRELTSAAAALRGKTGHRD